MAHLPGLKNYSHCPLKKRPLSFITDANTDDEQPQDLSIKRRRQDEADDNDFGRAKGPPTPVCRVFSSSSSSSSSSSPVAAHSSHMAHTLVQTPPSPPRMTSLADFYLKLFQTTAVQQQQQQQQQQHYEQHGDLWHRTPPVMWPMAQSLPAHPSAAVHSSHTLTAHSVLASRLVSSPHPSEDRLASPGSTASEDSGVGTETLSEDEIDVTGDSSSPSKPEGGPEGGPSYAAASGGGGGEERHAATARYSCNECRKSYSTYSGLSKHKQFHCVSLGNKSFACKHCEKVYTSLGALKMHIRTHTLPCKCPLCGKAFSRPWLLQGHIRTHTGEKPFQCPQCDRCFADRSNLRAHLQTHADIKKYACGTCHKTFSRVSLLNKHSEASCPARLQAHQQQVLPHQQEVPMAVYPAVNQS
ncbi:protein snail homolog Sna-like [Macrobrachium rosenbergii]|uniref:protein snail homolog Sna-like n=1 Tax=Macrobrachium rosenbergii TaxID=79674 RepID=UPI0034D3A50C